jgi:hypothetical protein
MKPEDCCQGRCRHCDVWRQEPAPAIARRLKRTPSEQFIAAYRRIQAAGGTYEQLAAEVDRSIDAVVTRVWKLRANGVALPLMRMRANGATAFRQKRHDDMEALDALLLSHVGRLTQRPPRELFSRVRDDYGEVGTRRLWRSLARLRAAGRVQRHNDASYTLARRRAA